MLLDDNGSTTTNHLKGRGCTSQVESHREGDKDELHGCNDARCQLGDIFMESNMVISKLYVYVKSTYEIGMVLYYEKGGLVFASCVGRRVFRQTYVVRMSIFS